MKINPFILLACAIASYALADESQTRPSNWATPLNVDGAPNLHKINNVRYQSAQPTQKGMEELQKMGIKTIINLRSSHSDQEELAGARRLAKNIPMKAWHPEWEEASKFLQVATDPVHQPVLFHCQAGSDRTGTMCTVYKIVVEGFHKVWQNLPA